MTSSASNPEFLYNKVLHFALQRHQVPIVHSLVIQNDTEEDWNQVKLTLSLDPELASPWTTELDSIPAGAIRSWESLTLEVRTHTLVELTEKISAQLLLKVERKEGTIWEKRYPIDVLAYDEWHGIGILPPMLSSFVTPNHPEIARVKQRAAALLEEWTQDPSLDAYQQCSPDRVRRQMAAVYEAIAEMEIIYCTAPASFETQGQRIRMVDSLTAEGMGNCLDMSLFYASCLEAIGLNPLLVIFHGHAMVGAWLVSQSFQDAAMDDASGVINRIKEEVNEIALVESTGMNKGKNVSFDQASDLAHNRLSSASDFELVIDVARSRSSRILPIPLRVKSAEGWRIMDDRTETSRVTVAPRTLKETEPVSHPQEPRTETKQQIWERKLLDLTLRNKLLNLRERRDTVHIVGLEPAILEDAIVGGEDFQILPSPPDWENTHRSSALYQAQHFRDPIHDLASAELKHRRLLTRNSEADLYRRITNLYRASRAAIEENGANTLFISLGCLKWYETEKSEKPLWAPILLLPVELVRRSSAQGYNVRYKEEEPMLNVTLLEKLKKDMNIRIQGLDELPEDENGVDVNRVFSLIRHAIKDRRRWQVEDMVVLDTFSFSRFVLWHDISRNSQHLARNKVVASLMEGQLNWEVEAEEERDLDQEISPHSFPLPIATDSAQREAIFSSFEGNSFVLHGPPGTGKSQTITNMIATALYAGKKVLFVASKKAALEVVQHRLEELGLGPFCLELHSNKATKSSVLEQLDRALKVGRTASPEEFRMEAERLKKLREELNAYRRALHHEWPSGISLYDAISEYINLGSEEPSFSFPLVPMGTLSREQKRDWEELVSEIGVILKEIGAPSRHPLYGIKTSQITPQYRAQIAEKLEAFLAALEVFQGCWEEVLSLLGLSEKKITRSQWAKLRALISRIRALPALPASFLLMSRSREIRSRLGEWIQHGRRRDKKRSLLLQHYSEGILGLEAEILLNAWNLAGTKWFLPRYFGQQKVVKALRPYQRSGRGLKENTPLHLEILMDYQEEQAFLQNSEYGKELISTHERGKEVDWDFWESALQAMEALYEAADQLLEPMESAAWIKHWVNSMGEDTGRFLSAYGGKLAAWEKAAENLEVKSRELALIYDFDRQAKDLNSVEWMERTRNQVKLAEGSLDRLKGWTNWKLIKEQAVRNGLTALVEALDSEAVGVEEVEVQYYKAFYKAMAEYSMSQFPELNHFNSGLFENSIARFRTVSERFEQLSREEIFAKLASQVPQPAQEASRNSEIGILRRAIRSRGRGVSIRTLFERIPHLLPRLTPCLLMSPISVAQYFKPGDTPFDLVIFDEASQMPTFEAVGAMARGENLIVVGDPKQMPPTSFFTITRVDEENELEDLESILDDCIALSMPSRYLRWHYRSRHESLIAFSNAHYYDNRLFTFPSRDDMVSRVSLHHVKGVYDKGKSRTNRAEAEEIVKEIIRRLKDPVLSSRSLGVVTFSISQQNLIEDMLTETFSKNPEWEAKAMNSDEPLFVKNLENVQGDERDVILFSICYGPDNKGKTSLQFGPLNKEGGERRLNVAVTRARYEMKVFSTIKAEDIDLSRTNSLGVAGLRSFLAFAERGKSILPSMTNQETAPPSGMERKLMEALKEKGFASTHGLGCSGFKIDVAVMDPDRPSEYILGILFDGERYKNSNSARDRTVGQEGVLRSLGWPLHRVWTMDWWEDPDRVIKETIEVLEGIIRDRDKEISVEMTEPPEERQKETTDPGAGPHEDRGLINSSVAGLSPLDPIPPSLPRNPHESDYEECVFPPEFLPGSGDFMSSASIPRIKLQIEKLLEVEAPINRDFLYQRIIGAWGISRLGTRIRRHLGDIVDRMGIQSTSHLQGEILWNRSQDPQTYHQYRVPKSGRERRSVEALPPEEVAVAMKAILEEQVSLPKEDLIKEAARRFGFSRTGDSIYLFFGEAAKIVKERSWAKEEEGRWVCIMA